MKKLLNKYGPIESFPSDVLGKRMDEAMLFKRLATLRTDAKLFDDVDELRWSGPTSDFPALAEKMGDLRLSVRANTLAAKVT